MVIRMMTFTNCDDIKSHGLILSEQDSSISGSIYHVFWDDTQNRGARVSWVSPVTQVNPDSLVISDCNGHQFSNDDLQKLANESIAIDDFLIDAEWYSKYIERIYETT